MLHSIVLIKSVHTLLFIFMIICVGIVLFTLIIDHISLLTWIGMGLMLLEGIILMANGWRCPLTEYAENLGASDGSVTNIFLPKCIADQMFIIFGILSFICIILLLIRVLA